MKRRPNYKSAIEWIAFNDEPNQLNSQLVSEYISTQLIADICGMDAMEVATDIVNLRLYENSRVGAETDIENMHRQCKDF